MTWATLFITIMCQICDIASEREAMSHFFEVHGAYIAVWVPNGQYIVVHEKIITKTSWFFLNYPKIL